MFTLAYGSEIGHYGFLYMNKNATLLIDPQALAELPTADKYKIRSEPGYEPCCLSIEAARILKLPSNVIWRSVDDNQYSTPAGECRDQTPTK